MLSDVERQPLEAACKALGGEPQALGVVTDVRHRDEVEQLADVTFTRFGRVDLVFSNAGVSAVGPVTALTHADWTWLIDVNLWGPIHGVEAFLPKMLEQGGSRGHLIFTSSYAGMVPSGGLAPYSAAKAGVIAMAEVLHHELQPLGVGVSVVCPMVVETNISTSKRNRPAEFGGPEAQPKVDPAVITEIVDPNIRNGVRYPPETVAAATVAAIGTERLYIFPQGEMREAVARRFASIDQGFEPLAH